MSPIGRAMQSTASVPRPRAVGATRVATVHVVALDDARQDVIVLDAGGLTIGRGAAGEGALVLDDVQVSRRHAAIARDGDGWMIRDGGSRNGTFVDGARVERARLRDGAVIRIGGSLLVFGDVALRGDERLALPGDTPLVGGSIAIMRVHDAIDLCARQPTPVLIHGETGVGKELVAEELHRRSRRTGAFVAVNCAAIAPALAESELFGHAAGAFTGAMTASAGLFAAADGGTLFLDEIGELPLELQAKLLRALAGGEIRAVGSSISRVVDVRVIAATLRDLDEAARADRFRVDLLNRLTAWRIDVPPLRSRRADIGAIAAAFATRGRGPSLSADAAEALLLHAWPGNVRELERVIAAARVRAQGAGSLELAHLPDELIARLGDRVAAADAVDPIAIPTPAPATAPTRDELCAALEELGGNVARVAERYGKDRQQVYRWARRHEIDVDAYRR